MQAHPWGINSNVEALNSKLPADKPDSVGTSRAGGMSRLMINYEFLMKRSIRKWNAIRKKT